MPREAFAPTFSVRTPEGLIAFTEGHPEFFEKVYSDDSLVTRRDAGGTSVSSSSQPSVMARMLEAFTVADGARVLEIGTGTGYNTALLCHRFGAAQVVSVDIDPELTAAAQERLFQIGYEPLVVAGDGTAGHADGAPYDGILATCGVHRIPAAWLKQVRPGGIIVTNIGIGIVRLTVDAEGGAHGEYLPEEAGFMVARPAADHVAETASKYTGLVINGSGHSHSTEIPEGVCEALVHPSALEVALLHPDVLSMSLTSEDGATVYGLVHPPTGAWCRITPGGQGGNARVTHDGPKPLWEERRSLLSTWIEDGRPGPDSYRLTVNSSGVHTLSRQEPSPRSWKLPPLLP